MKLIATFYSHFGAVRFVKLCKADGTEAKMMPVPRSLSSSCGTCVSYESDKLYPKGFVPDEVEQIVEANDTGYRQLYKAQDS